MADLRCTECDRPHNFGLTGIAEDGTPTCLDCGGDLTRVE